MNTNTITPNITADEDWSGWTPITVLVNPASGLDLAYVEGQMEDSSDAAFFEEYGAAPYVVTPSQWATDVPDQVLTDEEVGYLVSAAIESFGYGSFTYIWPEGRPEGIPHSEWWIERLLAGDTVELTDIDGGRHTVGIEDVRRGVTKVCAHRKWSPKELMDHYDVVEADAVMQFAVFGKWVYG